MFSTFYPWGTRPWSAISNALCCKISADSWWRWAAASLSWEASIIYHLEVGGRDFYIDLLFYQHRLRCLVAVELKIEEFEPEYAGKIRGKILGSWGMGYLSPRGSYTISNKI
ncbi:MAG: DUF1016 family protein [Armatimonadetes bacterium]|nr:DUF1016 family protein [Armatimonadota bacterium]